MTTFSYTIRDQLGIHARPAGSLAKVAKEFESEIYIEMGGKRVDATKIIAVMGMGIKHKDTITVTVNGRDEEEAEKAIRSFLEENL